MLLQLSISYRKIIALKRNFKHLLTVKILIQIKKGSLSC